MILVDTALQAREAQGKPIRVGIVGAGFMGQGLTNQIVNSVPGMRVVAMSNRKAREGHRRLQLLRLRGCRRRRRRSTSLTTPFARTSRSCTEDALLLARSEQIDVLVDVDRLGRVRCACGARGLQARQGRRADERRNRRDDRTDSAGLRRAARRHPFGLRRRRARRSR